MGEVLPNGGSLPHGAMLWPQRAKLLPSARVLLRLAGVVLREAGVEEADHGNVQAIEPDHRSVGLVAWSCQVQLGVMMKSPGRMMVRSPSTAVYAPEPSTMKRSALCVWRWLGAISPGRISCRPA